MTERELLDRPQVNLSHNKISFVTKKTFPSSPYIPYRLREVNLSHNVMPVLTNDLTIGTKKVEVLDVSHNMINEIRRGGCLLPVRASCAAGQVGSPSCTAPPAPGAQAAHPARIPSPLLTPTSPTCACNRGVCVNKGVSPILVHGSYAIVGGLSVDAPFLHAHVVSAPSSGPPLVPTSRTRCSLGPLNLDRCLETTSGSSP